MILPVPALIALIQALSIAPSQAAIANITPDSAATNYSVNGFVSFQQEYNQLINIRLRLTGFPPNSKHGIHIHQDPVQGQNCTTAGPHFNPMNAAHGAPDAEIRHYGDLGNFESDANGSIDIAITDRLASLYGENIILNRAVVVHALMDDLGLTSTGTSNSTGNAGTRAACGNIVWSSSKCPTKY